MRWDQIDQLFDNLIPRFDHFTHFGRIRLELDIILIRKVLINAIRNEDVFVAIIIQIRYQRTPAPVRSFHTRQTADLTEIGFLRRRTSSLTRAPRSPAPGPGIGQYSPV